MMAIPCSIHVHNSPYSYTLEKKKKKNRNIKTTKNKTKRTLIRTHKKHGQQTCKSV